MSFSAADYTDLELQLTPNSEQYSLTLRLSHPRDAADSTHGPFQIHIDQEALLALALDPDAYGDALCQALFADPSTATAFAEARAIGIASGHPLRLRLLLPASLQLVRWETLHDPWSRRPMALAPEFTLSRYLSTDDYQPAQLSSRPATSALLAVAAPADLERYGLTTIDAGSELALAKQALDLLNVAVLGDGPHELPTWERLSDMLRSGHDVLYLVAHGAFVAGQSWLYLADNAGRVARRNGAELTALIRSLGDRRPRLVVLASCESAGIGYNETLAALGPQLARAGVPAVLAMQGQVSTGTAQRFMAVLFQEVRYDGNIDRAVAAARRAVADRHDWWVPVLYTRLRTGKIWSELPVVAATPLPTTDQAAGPAHPPFMAPSLPDHVVPRPREFAPLIEHLCAVQAGPVALTGLRGAGGFGKTTLALAACYDSRVRATFADGVLWVTIGEHPSPADLVARLADLVERLTGSRPGFATVEAAAEELALALGNRRLLLVVDDVWDRTHLQPFLKGGEQCTRLITTRMRDILPPEAKTVQVDAMQPDEAVAVLGRNLPDTLEPALLPSLAARLGEWPVLLRLVNGALREQIETGMMLPDALAYVAEGLDQEGVTLFDSANALERDRAVTRTLGVSLALLTEAEQARFGELAIFPEDAPIPLATLTRYWHATGGLSSFRVRTLCTRLFRLSLLLAYDGAGQTVRLHDVVRAYLVRRSAAALWRYHAALLEAHRPPAGGWAAMPEDEPYLWDTLCAHLRDAGRVGELVATVTDPGYIIARCWLRAPLAFESDAALAQEAAPGEPTLAPLEQVIRQSGHLLASCEDRASLSLTLLSRLWPLESLARLRSDLFTLLAHPLLVPALPLPDLPDPALRRTLVDHSAAVNSCAVSADGLTLVSASDDRTLRVWDGPSGTLRATLTGHTDRVNSCAVSADGLTLVSASNDRTMHIYAAKSDTLQSILTGHTGWVRGCAISADGRVIVSAGDDQTVRVWDTARSTRSGFTGHHDRVRGCAISADGRIVVSGSDDRTVQVWDTGTGSLLRRFTSHTDAVNGCAASADGRTIVSTSDDGTVRVWDTSSGELRTTLLGHSAAVNDCAISADGLTIVSASNDLTVRVWDAVNGTLRATLAGHTDWVRGCAISADGLTVVSASNDQTVRVWDTVSGTLRATLTEHSDRVTGCAISADGATIVATSRNCTVRVWRTATSSVLATLHVESQLLCCACSARGDLLVAGGTSGGVYTLRLV